MADRLRRQGDFVGVGVLFVRFGMSFSVSFSVGVLVGVLVGGSAVLVTRAERYREAEAAQYAQGLREVHRCSGPEFVGGLPRAARRVC